MIKLLILSTMIWAEDAHHMAETAAHGDAHHAVHIPWSSLGVQAFNFFLLLGLLGYLLHKTVKAHFAHRVNDYKQMVERAEAAKLEAERGHSAIKERLAKLESGAAAGLQRAKQEAAEMKVRMAAEAKSLSEKLQQEARRTTLVEIEKAKAELRHELLTNALTMSNDNLKNKLSSSEQKKLQNEFVEKIQVVGG